MDGTLDIQRISNPGSAPQHYQVRYENAIGESFVGEMGMEELRDLLYEKLGMNLSGEELGRSIDVLVQDGRVIFPEIVLKSNELAGAGLRFLEVEG